jgi:hypothetical protein
MQLTEVWIGENRSRSLGHVICDNENQCERAHINAPTLLSALEHESCFFPSEACSKLPETHKR